jgi:hypothetical protein
MKMMLNMSKWGYESLDFEKFITLPLIFNWAFEVLKQLTLNPCQSFFFFGRRLLLKLAGIYFPCVGLQKWWLHL